MKYISPGKEMKKEQDKDNKDRQNCWSESFCVMSGM